MRLIGSNHQLWPAQSSGGLMLANGGWGSKAEFYG